MLLAKLRAREVLPRLRNDLWQLAAADQPTDERLLHDYWYALALFDEEAGKRWLGDSFPPARAEALRRWMNVNVPAARVDEAVTVFDESDWTVDGSLAAVLAAGTSNSPDSRCGFIAASVRSIQPTHGGVLKPGFFGEAGLLALPRVAQPRPAWLAQLG